MTDGGDRADGSVSGDGSGDTLATADAVACIGGRRLTEMTDGGYGGDRTWSDASVSGDVDGDSLATAKAD